jgi:Fe-S oxidoreductase
MFAKEVRLEAAIDGKLPDYINTLLDNCLETGNAYGKTEVDQTVAEKLKAHSAKTDTLFVLGADATYLVPELAIKAIKILDKAGVCYTVLEDAPATGAELDFLIGAADETKSAMEAFAEVANQYKNVVLYDPVDAKTVKQTFKEYGVEVSANVYTYTAFLAELVKEGKLVSEKKDITVIYQDPYAHARDLGETEEAREVIKAFANLHEFHLNRKETVFAGSLLMAEYMPKVMNEVAARRIFNATAVNENVIVTASPAEYVCLKAVDQDKVQILSIEDVIL